MASGSYDPRTGWIVIQSHRPQAGGPKNKPKPPVKKQRSALVEYAVSVAVMFTAVLAAFLFGVHWTLADLAIFLLGMAAAVVIRFINQMLSPP